MDTSEIEIEVDIDVTESSHDQVAERNDLDDINGRGQDSGHTNQSRRQGDRVPDKDVQEVEVDVVDEDDPGGGPEPDTTCSEYTIGQKLTADAHGHGVTISSAEAVGKETLNGQDETNPLENVVVVMSDDDNRENDSFDVINIEDDMSFPIITEVRGAVPVPTNPPVIDEADWEVEASFTASRNSSQDEGRGCTRDSANSSRFVDQNIRSRAEAASSTRRTSYNWNRRPSRQNRDTRPLRRNLQPNEIRQSNNEYSNHAQLNTNNFRPGLISPALREALNVRENELPEFIYKMRKVGYPPGYIREAAEETRQGPILNREKLPCYDGFNTSVPSSVNDDGILRGARFSYIDTIPNIVARWEKERDKKTQEERGWQRQMEAQSGGRGMPEIHGQVDSGLWYSDLMPAGNSSNNPASSHSVNSRNGNERTNLTNEEDMHSRRGIKRKLSSASSTVPMNYRMMIDYEDEKEKMKNQIIKELMKEGKISSPNSQPPPRPRSPSMLESMPEQMKAVLIRRNPLDNKTKSVAE